MNAEIERCSGMGVQAPLDPGSQQRGQAVEVNQSRLRDRLRSGVPGMERLLVAVGHRERLAVFRRTA
ncbi:hypothetical protein [Streptomyces lavendofoliae]|uniref:hypothetical protein n=1 Tax=Streptomyces lavendofoliae TaxID=67314 RepID=UPI00300F35FA